MSHLPWGANAGFTQSVQATATQRVRSSLVITNNYVEHCTIERELVSKLVDELFRKKLISIHQERSTENNNKTFIAELIVAQPGVKMVNVQNEVFTINGEWFNESDIITALRHTFPERLI